MNTKKYKKIIRIFVKKTKKKINKFFKKIKKIDIKKFKKKKYYIILGIVLLLSLVTVSFGRYIYNDIRNFYLSTKSFYFNSDKLTVNRRIYQIDNWSAVDPYPVTINLNNRKNNYIRAKSDINYTVSYVCSSNVTCSINSTGGVLSSNGEDANFTAIVTPNGTYRDGEEAFIEITVHSTYPYKKTMSGRFILKVGKTGITYAIDDVVGRPYFNFNITNTLDYYLVKQAFGSYSVGSRIDRNTYINLAESDKGKCLSAEITLTFDPTVTILDMTNTVYLKAKRYTTTSVGGYDYINSITFDMDSESSEVVKFYKANVNENYTYPIVNDSSIINFSYSQ